MLFLCVKFDDLARYKGIAFDLDGTLTESVDFLKNPRAFGNIFKLLFGALHYKSGVAEFLTKLKEKGFKVALVSNANKFVLGLYFRNRALNRVLPLMRAFDMIISKHSVKHRKPAPDIYLLTAQKMGIAPSEMFIFEDSLEGAKSAHAGGFDFCVIKSKYAKHEWEEMQKLTPWFVENYEGL